MKVYGEKRNNVRFFYTVAIVMKNKQPKLLNPKILQKKFFENLYKDDPSLLKKEVFRLTQLALSQNFSDDKELGKWLAHNILNEDEVAKSTAIAKVPKWPNFFIRSTHKENSVGMSMGKHSCILASLAYRTPKIIYKTEVVDTTSLLAEISQIAKNSNMVATIPAYVNDDERLHRKEMLQSAGFHVIRMINEPLAAILAYGLEATNQNIVIFDLGADSFDLTAIQIEDEVCETLETKSIPIGSKSIDAILVEWVANSFYLKFGIDLKKIPVAMQNLQKSCDEAKKTLCRDLRQARIFIPNIVSEKSLDLDVTISFAMFEKLIENVCHEIQQHANQFLQQHSHISQVILAGGGMYIPVVVQKVKKICKCNVLINKEPDTIYAIGAAVQGEIFAGYSAIRLEPQKLPMEIASSKHIKKTNMYSPSPKYKANVIKDVLLLDVTPLSIGIEINGKMQTIIPRNTTIPTLNRHTFISTEKTRDIYIQVLRGEGVLAKDNKIIGGLNLENLPKHPKKITVTIEINVNGNPYITAREESSGISKEIEIPAFRLSEEEIERAGEEIKSLEITSDSPFPEEKEDHAYEETKLQAIIYDFSEQIASNDDLQRFKKRYKFEKFLSEDAAIPGPIERMFAQSKQLLKYCQYIFGLYFVMIAHIADVLVDTIVGYVNSVYKTWRLYTAIERRITRGTPLQQLDAVKKDFYGARKQISQIFRFNGAHIEHSYETTFPLELVIKTRYLLDTMKQDLSFITYQQTIEIAQQNLWDCVKLCIPNPVEMISKWKDCAIMALLMKYSRQDIEQMYMEFVKSYFNIIYLFHEDCNQEFKETLYEYEKKILPRIQSNYIPYKIQDLEPAIAQCKQKLQRLLQALFCSQRFIFPQNWQRIDLLREFQTTSHPIWCIEWECWLTKEVEKLWLKKGGKISLYEKELRLSEYKERREYQKLLKQYIKCCW